MNFRTTTLCLVCSFTLASCGVPLVRHREKALETAYRSRTALVTGYNKEYAAALEKWIGTLKEELADPDTRDEVGLLFALDELAEVYASRMVDFQKARIINDEAKTLARRIRTDGHSGKVGWYFNINRRLYPIVARFLWPSEELSSPPSEMMWTEKRLGPVKTIYPRSFLRTVTEFDIGNIERRIEQRDKILQEALGQVTRFPNLQLLPDPLARLEFSAWESLLKVLDEPNRSWFLLERLWALGDTMEPEEWRRAVARAGEQALAGVLRSYSVENDYRELQIRFRLGMAYLWLGSTRDGIQVLEEMLRGVEKYDQHQAKLRDEARSQIQKGRTWWHMWWLLHVGNPLAWPLIPIAMLTTETRANEAWSMLDSLYGKGKHGLAAFLTEHERLGFHFEMGRAYEAVGRNTDAIAEYKKAIEIIEQQRATIRTEAGRIQYLIDKQKPYDRLIPLLLRMGDAAAAFEYSERARSRAFLDLLAGGQLKFGTAKESESYSRIFQMQAEIEMLVEAGGIGRPLATTAYAEMRSIEVQPRTQTDISLEFESLTSVKAANAGEISRTLGDKAALLSFYVGESETSVFLVQDGSVSGWVMPVGRASTFVMASQLRQALSKPGVTRLEKWDAKEVDELGLRLYREVMMPALKAVRKRVLYVVPHGPLHYIPLAAIHDGSGYLIDRFTLLTIPSGTVLTYLEKKPSSAGATVVLANPELGDSTLDLPYAEHEGNAIRKLRPRAMVWNRRAATKAVAQEWAPKAEVLHFATHATLDIQRPMESALLLARGSETDGRLTVGEIFGIRLPGSLVVLSACETGLGQVATGDELIGLTRAFMYAGAPHMIASLWNVNDETTAVLMEKFYERTNSKPVAEALRDAQTELRSRYSHPYYWAAFTVFGHYR